MCAIAGLKPNFAPRDHFFAEADEAFDNVAQVSVSGSPRIATCGRESWRRRVAPQLVQHYVRVASRFRSMTMRTPLGWTRPGYPKRPQCACPWRLRRLGRDLLADLVRDLGQNDRAAVAAAFFDMSARAHQDQPRPVIRLRK
jgi:hypothetical protein